MAGSSRSQHVASENHWKVPAPVRGSAVFHVETPGALTPVPVTAAVLPVPSLRSTGASCRALAGHHYAVMPGLPVGGTVPSLTRPEIFHAVQ
jgi:hypothetical protein